MTTRGIIVIPLITNLLGADSYGVWTTVLAFIGLLSSSGGLHLHGSLIRYGSQDVKEEQAYSDILLLATLLGVILALLVFASGFILDISSLFEGSVENSRELVIYSAVLVMASIILQINTNFPRSKGAVRTYDFLLLMKSIFEISSLIFVFISGSSVVYGILGLAIISIVFNVVIMAYIFRRYSIPIPKIGNIGEYLRYGVPMVPKEISTSLLNNADKYLILIFISPTSVGIFAVARSISQFVTRFSTIFNSTLYPSVSEAWDKGKTDELSNLYTLIFRYYTLLAVPTLFGLTLLDHSIMAVISTKGIADAGSILIPILTVGFLIQGYSQFLNYILTSTESTNEIAYVTVVSVVLNIGLNIMLIPILGIVGAAIATTMSQVALFTLTYRYSTNHFRFSFPTKTLGRSTISSLIMAVVLLIVNTRLSSIGKILFYSLFGSLLYFSVLYIVGEFTREELENIGETVQDSLR